MRSIGLRGRFLLAGGLILATSTASSLWSALAFRRVSLVMDATLRDSEQTTAAMGSLASNLEREDDALLLTLTDESRGRLDLTDRREAVNSALLRIDRLPFSSDELDIVSELRHDVDAYHAAGDALLSGPRDGARVRYHEEVNPLLRHAVSRTARVRDDHFRSTQEVAAWARDQASRATQILVAVFAAALLLSILVGFYLARVVLLPIGELTRAVDALRRGDFERRVAVERQDELGQLEEGFNRMADDLAEFRRANIGEVIRAKETLEVTLAALPDAVVVIEAGGEVSSANARADEVIRAQRGGMPARHLRDLPLPEAARAAIEASLRGEQATLPIDLSKAMTLTTGTERKRLLPRIIPIEGLVGGRRGAVLLLSDVTELVRLDEMRLELVAVASHELRTPLTTLRMTLLMLQERAARLEQRDRELVGIALLGVEQLATTVGEFLDLTRIEAGQLRLVFDHVDMKRLLHQAIETLKPACEEAQIELDFAFHPDAPSIVEGDGARLAVVVNNVLGNARKYSPAGGAIDIEAQLVEREGERSELQISIADRGPGVPDEFRERIFDKFFRVEHYRPDAEEGVRGSGIGLYIAREIVIAHGGSIACEPRAGGRGARFVVSIPVDRA